MTQSSDANKPNDWQSPPAATPPEVASTDTGPQVRVRQLKPKGRASGGLPQWLIVLLAIIFVIVVLPFISKMLFVIFTLPKL